MDNDGIFAYTCTCLTGYSGDNCEQGNQKTTYCIYPVWTNNKSKKNKLFFCQIDLIGSQESCESVAREGGTISGYYNLNLYSSAVARK